MIEYLNVNDPYTVVPEYPRLDQRAVPSGEAAIWIEPGRIVTIDNQTLRYGNFYFGAHLGATYGECNDNGVINPRLITSTAGEGGLYNTHEPPSYRLLPPRLRREYLQWLAGGSLDRHVSDDFASIYFYGLEHRLMVDMRGNAPKVMTEIRRLAEIFPGAARLQRDVARLELFMGKKTANRSRPVFTSEMLTAVRPAPSVLIYLGRKLKNEGCIDAKDAFLWAQSSFKVFFPRPYHRCRNEFEALFERRFELTYPNGLAVTARRPFKLFYRTATWHRRVDMMLPDDAQHVLDIEDAPGLLEQINRLVGKVGEELEPYDRFVARKPDAARSIEAVPHLPALLRCSPWIGRFGDVKRTVDENLSKSSYINTDVSSFLAMLDLPVPDKGMVSVKAVTQVGILLDALHIGFEPDRRYGFSGLSSEGSICLFRAEDGGEVAPDNMHYRGVRALVEIAVLAAVSDGQANQREMEVVKTLLTDAIKLNDLEKRRMTAVAKILIKGTVSPASALSNLVKMPPAIKARAVDLAIDVILADGPANPQEIAFAEKLFKMLSRPVEELYVLLHRLDGERDGLVVVQRSEKIKGVAIATKADIGRPDSKVVIAEVEAEAVIEMVVIDVDRLSRLRQETEEVSALLSDIFKEEPVAVERVKVTSPAAGDSLPFSGLDAAHGRLLTGLLDRTDVDEVEFARLSRELKLMPGGALETLNEWGFDNFGDAIIDEAEGFSILADFVDAIVLKRKS